VSFKEVANLVNRISGTRIDVDSPKVLNQDQYAVYGGTASTSGFAFSFEILYVFADATKDGIKGAYAWLNRQKDKSKVKVVHAPSVTPSIIEELRARSIDPMSLADYFASFMQQQTLDYIGKIRELTYHNYIEPQIRVPAGLPRKFPNPVLSFLSSSTTGGRVAVLLGEPGQGKTHMSKFLAVELTKLRQIPIYVHSEQWTKMQIEDLSSIWKTIVASFRYFNAPIGWAEGVERDFIRVSLKLGIFRLIFDGFDEFILWNRGTIDARESLQELVNLAEDTGTPLCITSRTSFYNSEVAEGDGVNSAKDVLDYLILPFDANHAENYFKKRFGDNSPLVRDAIWLFRKLSEDSTGGAGEFVGRGFFLSLIADLVARGVDVQIGAVGSQTRIQWIMDALCKREQVRQTLPLDARAQISVFREFAALVAKGEPRDTSTLRFVLATTENLSEQQIEELVKLPAKLKDHPLIRAEKGSWVFTQDQIEYFLLAEFVLALCGRAEGYSELQALLNSSNFTKSLHTEVATALIQLVFAMQNDLAALESCKKIVETISLAGRSGFASAPTGCHQFAGTIALLAAGRAHLRGSNRTERTAALLNLLPAGQLVGVQFIGTMSSLDFRGLKVSDCHFDTVTFANCRFGPNTTFTNCHFTDLRVKNCEQFGSVKFDSTNTFDEVSRRLVEAEMISAGERNYAVENLHGDMDCLIRRFLPRETNGFKNIEERNLSRGVIGHSVNKGIIIDSFKRECLTSHPVGGNVVYVVKEEVKQDFFFFVSNGVFTGRLADLYDELKSKLVITA
jgi:hypothetical protein